MVCTVCSDLSVPINTVLYYAFSFSYNVRFHLDKYLRQALADSQVTSIVIVGKTNNFSAGADIKEFETGKKKGN